MIHISIIILMINNISDMEIHISGDTRGPFLFVLLLIYIDTVTFLRHAF